MKLFKAMFIVIVQILIFTLLMFRLIFEVAQRIFKRTFIKKYRDKVKHYKSIEKSRSSTKKEREYVD